MNNAITTVVLVVVLGACVAIWLSINKKKEK
jgi:hypothetical protein